MDPRLQVRAAHLEVVRRVVLKKLQHGFSLVEVVLSVAILVILAMGASQLLRNSFDMKFALSETNKVTHRMDRVMQRLARDIEHAYIVSSKDELRFSPSRRGKTIFKIPRSGGERLELTTMSKQPFRKNAKESDVTYVVYEIKKSDVFNGRADLYRGESPFLPDDLQQDPPMEVLAHQIKSLSVKAWDGDRWSESGWDSSSGDTVDRIPYMVQVKVEAWEDDPAVSDVSSTGENDPVDTIQTVIYLNNAVNFTELKQGAVNFKWF